MKRKPKPRKFPAVWIAHDLTRIGHMIVPVRDFNRPSIVDFAGGAHGPTKETGKFAFWTAVLKSHKGKGVIGRAYLTLPPGERFDRIRRSVRHRNKAVAQEYGRTWKILKNNVAYVRPSTIPEINRWARSHMLDWDYAYRAYVKQAIYYSPLYELAIESLRSDSQAAG